MKIALVSPYGMAVPGGVQQQVLELAGWLRGSGHDAYVVAPTAGGREATVDLGSTVGIPANGAVAPIALSPRVFGRLKRAVQTADIVHIHEPFIPLVGWAALRSGQPTVLTFHADPSRLIRGAYRVTSPVLRSIAKSAQVSAVSATAASAIRGAFEETVTIPNGLDVASYRLDVPRVPRQLAFLGRPDPRKGRDLLLDAWPTVLSAVPDATLVVIGGGDPAAIDGVRFLGRVDEDEKRRRLASSEVLCAPNRGGESFGITLAEGMAAGCATVASDIPAFVNLLDGSGVHFPNGDRDSLVESLVSLLSDPARLRERSAASMRRIAMFDWDVVGPQYLDLYANVS